MTPVNEETPGRRFVQVEVEVPGTPEEVWQAIATGPGISSWFVPTMVDGRVGGTATSDFGPGMESVASITAWDPPRRFIAESADLGPGAPVVASEWIVEARGGGTCTVRVVHSLFTDRSDWDKELEGWESGWPYFFILLQLYRTHFPNQAGSAFRVMGASDDGVAVVWSSLLDALGLAAIGAGQSWTAPAGPPAMAGVMERVGTDEIDRTRILRLDKPAPGILSVMAHPMGRVFLSMDFYLYGPDAAAVVAREEPEWTEWMEDNFPADD